MSIDIDTFDYERLPETPGEAEAAVRRLVHRHARGQADEDMLLDALGIGTEAGNPPALCRRSEVI